MKEGGTPLYATAKLGDSVSAYSEQHSTSLPKHIADYHASASSHEDSMMLSSNFQSQFHLLLAGTVGAKRVLEIGVFLGYSALVWAHAVGPDGVVTGLEYSPEYAQVAKDAFDANGVKNVEVIVGGASETLPTLTPSAPYDIVFIDADKEGYPGYLTQLLAGSKPGSASRLLRPGALIIADNVLRRGFVADESSMDANQTEKFKMQLKVVREFNDQCVAEPRLQTFLMPLWDGLSIMRLVD